MDAEIVLDQNDGHVVREVDVGQVFQDASVIHGGVAICDLHVAPAFERSKRIARYEKMKLIKADGAKLIDAQPINGKPQRKPQIETKPPLARTPDRRFRRF